MNIIKLSLLQNKCSSDLQVKCKVHSSPRHPDLYYQPHSNVRMEVYVAVNQPETCPMFIRFLLINIYSQILHGVSLFSFSFSYIGNKIGNFHVNHAMTCTLISTKKMAFLKLLIAFLHYRTKVYSHRAKVNVKAKIFFDV